MQNLLALQLSLKPQAAKGIDKGFKPGLPFSIFRRAIKYT